MLDRRNSRLLQSTLDKEFDVREGAFSDPELGYKGAACFLIWLSESSETVVADLNDFLGNNGHKISNHDEIFINLKNIKTRYRELQTEYFIERRK